MAGACRSLMVEDQRRGFARKPGTDVAAVPVGEIMKTAVVTVDPRDSLLEADRLMRLCRIRHLPVARKGMLVGVISHRDVMEASLASADEPTPEERMAHLRRIPAERIIKGPPRTVEPGCPARDAVLLMLRLKIGCLPVVAPGDRGELLGIVTESDLLRLAYTSVSEEDPSG